MKAIVQTKYGPPSVLKPATLERPRPKTDEVLIRNYGSSLNTVDVVMRSGTAPSVTFRGVRTLIGLFLRLSFGGLPKQKQVIPGCGFAGKIASLGKNAAGWKIGDHVYGYHQRACAEYMTVPGTWTCSGNGLRMEDSGRS